MRVVAIAFMLGALCAADARAAAPPATPMWTWAVSTSSPLPIDDATLTAHEAALLAHCGVGDEGLRVVARRIVSQRARELPRLDAEDLAFAMRAAGEPHVWPRTWLVSGRALDRDATLAKMDAWRATFHNLGDGRCGVATGLTPGGTEIVAAVAVDALADLAPLPVRTRIGAWLTVDATFDVPASGARVIVQGPGTDPRTVPTSFSGGHARARFVPDRPGAFTVQVVADVSTGPRPVLEARFFADVEPPDTMAAHVAPGEDAGAGATDEPLALTRMILALRAGEQLPPLARDPRLDALARAHAQQMLAARTTGHDLGDGDPAARLAQAGLTAKLVAENVAHAPTTALAHRALYASPSHRANLLRGELDRLGVAVVDDPDGSVWVAEVFASGLR